MTFTSTELLHLSTMLLDAKCTDDMRENDILEEIERKITYASMSGCERATFYFSDKRLICLVEATEVALKEKKEVFYELYEPVCRRVKEEAMKRGLIRVDNATSTTSNT